MDGKKFKHYKGGVYEVICVALCTETSTERVIYKDTAGNVWDRPLTMWNELVNGVQRFKEVKEDEL